MRRPVALMVALLAGAGCLEGGEDTDEADDGEPGIVGLPGAFVELELGTFAFVFYADIAPATVEQVTDLVASGFYNGSVIERNVDNFVIQGGSPPEGRESAPTLPLEAGGYFSSGAVGIARDTDPNTGTSVWFVCEYPQPHLQERDPLQSPLGFVSGEYTMFGQVVQGMEVVRAIAEIPHDAQPNSETPADPPPFTMRLGLVPVPQEAADELPYRTWGRHVTPPYRVSVESPATLVAGEETWLRVYVESQIDRSAQTGVDPIITIEGGDVAVEVEPVDYDGNIRLVRVTFPRVGTFTLDVADGVRPMTSFQIGVAESR